MNLANPFESSSSGQTRRSSTIQKVRATRRRRQEGHAAIRALVEICEPRMLLAANLRNQVPTTITPASVAQTLLAPGNNTFSLTSTSTSTPTSGNYRFAVNNAVPGQLTTFTTAFSSGTTQADAVIALYDSSGNRVQLQDADSPSATNETLSVALDSDTVYTVQFYGLRTAAGTTTLSLGINPGAQAMGSTLALDPAINSGAISTAAAPDAFTSSGNVRYIPLNLLNAGGSANLTVSPLGPDTAVKADVFLQTSTNGWTQWATQTLPAGQASATLLITPPSTTAVNDGKYVLALSPLNFTAAPQPVTVVATTPQPLSPATVTPASAISPLFETLTAGGTLSGQVSGSVSAGGSALYSIVAPVSGSMSVTSTGGFPKILSAYGPNGAALLSVNTTNNSSTQVTTTFNVVAGNQYFIRVAGYIASSSGSFTLTATQSVTSTAATVATTLGQQANLQIGPNFGGKAFRLTTPVGSQFLAIQLAPDAGSTLFANLTVIGSDGVARTATGSAAGQPATLILDQSANGGPYDVFVTSSVGTGTASLKYTSLNVPTAPTLNQYSTSLLSISGGLSSNVFPVTTGTPIGIQYFQPANAANAANTLYTATATNSGAASILLHYIQDGNGFRLVDSAAPAAGSTSPNLFVPARGQVMHALVAVPVNFSGSGSIQFTVGGPAPLGLGLTMVPNAIPNGPVPPGGYQSTASIGGARLENNIERDLYSVQIPFNLSSTSSTLNFTPTDIGGPLRVTVSVFNSANQNIGNQTSVAGQPVSVPVTGLVAGQTLRFEVKAVNNSNVGAGGYGLSFAVNTTNPLPYLVTQDFFYPYTASQVAGRSYLPNGISIPTIPLNGSVQGNFTSSTPYSNNGTGSIQVFKVTGWTDNSRFQITTTDVDAGVNTNIALYYLGVDNSGNPAYRKLAGTAPSFDYYPGDRSAVDSRIVVNNTDLDPVYGFGEIGGGPITVYAVVMNEQGTQGRYNITATQPVPTEIAGPGTVTPANIIIAAPRNAGGATLPGQQTIQTVNGTSFALRTPSDMNGNGTAQLTVKTVNFSTGQTINVNVSRGILFVGSTSGVVGAGGVVTIPMQSSAGPGEPINTFLSPGQTYTVTITASSFPASGLALNLTVPYITPTGTVPPTSLTTGVPQDAGYTSSITRMRANPAGAIAENPTPSGGVFSSLFSMTKAGAVSFTINSASGGAPAVGLYQVGKSTSGPPFTDISVLLDFDNTRTSNNFVLGAQLPAGTYFLRGQGFDASPITITGTIPAATARVLEVEPGTGLTQQSEQTIINQGAFGSTTGTTNNGFVHSRFNSSYFKLTVPSNANGQPVTFSLFDATGYLSGPPTPPVGRATLSMYRVVNNVYTRVATAIDAVNSSTHSATISAGEPAVPGAVYYVGVDFNAFQYAAYAGFNVPVFQSGVADFSVAPITLTANAGSTLVQSAINNGSFTSSPTANYTVQLGSSTSTRTIPTLAPFGNFAINLSWAPGAASDVVTITADPSNAVPELSNSNNTQSKALSTVNPTAPTVLISLADTLMTGEGNANPSTGGGIWGRYISGVSGQATTIRVAAGDTDSNLYQIVAKIQNGNGTFALDNLKVFYTNGTSTFTSNIPFDFGSLGGTTATNLNQLKFYAIDQFGLKTPTYIQTLNVATRPSFLTGGTPGPNVMGAGGSVTFNAATHQFKYDFQNSIISVSKTLSDLMGIDVPVIGDKKNEFLVSITGTGTSGFSPVGIIPLSLSGHAKLTAMDQSIFDKTVNGQQTSGSITFKTEMSLNARSLVPSSTSVSLQVANLQLIDYKSPKIPIYSLGIPGIAEVKASIKFGLNAKLNAGAKIGFDPLAGGVGGYLGSLGVMSPTFIQPIITGSATVAGDISVLGFDIAELSGTVGLELTITLGLDNDDPGDIISFADAPTDLALTVGAKLKVHLAASVAIIGDIYTYDWEHDFGNIVNTIDEGIFLTDPPSFANGKFIGPPARPGRIGSGDDEGPAPVIKNGSSLVGAYAIDPSPQLVINNSVLNGMGLSMQLVNAGTAGAPVANLAFTNRVGGVWSALTTLSGANDVADPVLALTRDGAGTPGVVVYTVDNIAGTPVSRTLNQRLNGQDIRYRYFNGTTWGAEQSVTSDSFYDSQQSTAFNASGEGVLAYVRNGSSAPINGSGVLDSASNNIYASVWNPFTHTWGSPLIVTSTAGNDSSPSTFVDASGKRTVVWIHSEAGVSQLMFSTNTGSGWSPQAPVSITGLAAGGKFTNVALGSDGANRLDVVFSYVSENADGSMNTKLYHRPATVAGFAGVLPAVQIAENSTFSGLKTTNAPSGALVAYWQQSDGESNQIVETTILSGVATTPVQISTSQNLAKRPSAAVDGDGKIQLLYANEAVYGGTMQGSSGDPTVGAPTAAGVASSSVSSLPQLTFLSGLAFPVESQASAAIGSTINGTAVIANRGLASASVTVTAYRGIPGAGGVVVGTPFTITLAPGASYNVTQPFTVVAGNQTYSLQLTTPSQQAFNSTTENISSAPLKGLVDITMSLAGTVPSPAPGAAQTLQATVFNPSTAGTGSFVVTLYAGDPLSPQSPLTVVGTQTVSNLIPLQSAVLNFPITLPGVAGDYIYTARADSAETIEESNENNNIGRYEVHFRADPAVVLATDGSGPVVATLLNSGTSNNVQVVVNVANLGATNMVNVPVNLRVSRNGGAFISLGQQIIASLPAGALTSVTFTVTSLGGDNQYVASFDPSITPQDINLGNNVGTANLIVPGLAALSATASLSAGVSVAGSALSLTANITNSGLADAVNVPLRVIARLTAGGPSYVVGSGSITLAGLSSGAALINLDTSALPRGLYTFTLEVDPDEAILQDAATNDVPLPVIIQTPLVLTAAAQYLRLNNDGQRLDIWDSNTMAGSPSQQVFLSTISSLSSSNSASGQIIHVDFSNANPLPATGLNFNGNAAGFNSLDVIGAGASDSFTFNNGSIVFSNEDVPTPATITRTNVNSITLNGSSDRDVMTLNYAGGNPLPSELHLRGEEIDIIGLQNLNGTTLDIGRTTVFVKYTPGNSPVAAIRQALIRGYNSGGWNGASTAGVGAINSVFAAASAITGIGYADFADGRGVNTTPNSIVLKYTLRADANLDGAVNFSDLVSLAQFYNLTPTVWDQGDFNFDGKVDFGDLVILAQEYNLTLGSNLVEPPPIKSMIPGKKKPDIDELLGRVPTMRELPNKAPKGFVSKT